MEIRSKTGKSINNLSILNTYAPHMQYDQEDISNYWEEVRKTLDGVHKNLIKIWRTDNNGKIAQTEQNESIGKWTIGTKTDIGNGGNFASILAEQQLTCVHTFFIPPKNDIRELETCHIYDANLKRQIDFISINRK